MAPVRRTEKQKEIMSLILEAAAKGEFYGGTELQRALSYEPSYSAFRCSIRFLEKAGMIERERDGRRVVLVPTELGFRWFG